MTYLDCKELLIKRTPHHEMERPYAYKAFTNWRE
jgi:hypothetical protein